MAIDLKVMLALIEKVNISLWVYADAGDTVKYTSTLPGSINLEISLKQYRDNRWPPEYDLYTGTLTQGTIRIEHSQNIQTEGSYSFDTLNDFKGKDLGTIDSLQKGFIYVQRTYDANQAKLLTELEETIRQIIGEQNGTNP